MKLTRILGILAVAIITASGCSEHPPHDPQPGSPTPTVEQLHPQFSYVWSAGSSVDLFSRPAELIRATREALYLTQVFGPDKTFPGYMTAIGGPKDPRDPNYRFETTQQAEAGFVEIGKSPQTLFFHIAELTISADHTNIEAIVCGYTIAAPDNTTGLNPNALRDAHRIELSGPASDTQPTSLVDDHPDRVDPRAEMPPSWNVFQSWHITKLVNFEPGDIPARCGDWWQSQLPYLWRPPGENILNPPPGDPHFQMPREPVKPQFPEWIKANQM
ncbi:hypothetical protein [Mycobacterium camsae]|uniref:hypothetical protein n=1 Tax=Mycobacterium gordonae TaxID=1778 RepID=UPI00197FBB5A|nr:hypothetical protein [Mycobacterium gordonae]